MLIWWIANVTSISADLRVKPLQGTILGKRLTVCSDNQPHELVEHILDQRGSNPVLVIDIYINSLIIEMLF